MCPYRVAEAQSVQGPYLGLAAVLFVLAVVVYLFRLPTLKETIREEDATEDKHTIREALSHPHVLFVGIQE